MAARSSSFIASSVSLSILKIPTAKIFEPLLKNARYKGVYGGRGSGKSHFFGELLVETCQAERGTLAVCIREAQRTLAQSSKRLIESKVATLGLGHGFKVFSDKIATPGDGIIIFRGMQDHTADSIKSLEGFRIAWVDEAQSLSARSLALLRPTIRRDGSELWASWNPYNVPLAGGMDYWGATVPNSSFAFPIGQAISRATYASLFAIMGTTYGSGDGSTTFNLPDKTGRVSAMKEAAATRLTSSFFGGNSTLMGAVGGAESHTLTIAEMPTHQHSVFLKDPAHAHPNSSFGGTGTQFGTAGGGFQNAVPTQLASTGITIGSTSGTANDNQTALAGSGAAHAIVQPTIICNYILRII
jgi:microcystin-dependent protein